MQISLTNSMIVPYWLHYYAIYYKVINTNTINVILMHSSLPNSQKYTHGKYINKSPFMIKTENVYNNFLKLSQDSDML